MQEEKVHLKTKAVRISFHRHCQKYVLSSRFGETFELLGFGGELPILPDSAHPWTGAPVLGLLTLAGQLSQPQAAPSRPRAGGGER